MLAPAFCDRQSAYAQYCAQELLALASTDTPRLLHKHGTQLLRRRFTPYETTIHQRSGVLARTRKGGTPHAEQLADAFAKETVLDIARSYDNLAVLAKTRPVSETSD
jgi:hypothetical protein